MNRRGMAITFLGDLLIKVAWLLVALVIIGGIAFLLMSDKMNVFGWG